MSEALDRLAMLVARGGSRRDALKYFGGLLAGGFLLGATGRARAEDGDDGDGDDHNEEINEKCQKYCASCRKLKRSHGAHGDCIRHCKRFLRNNPKGTLCGSCTAEHHFTGCASGTTCCTPKGAAAFCTNTGTDAKNCGACGNVCPTAKPTCCSGACVDTQTDPKHCGTCGTVCSGTTPNCKAGKCVA